MRVQDGEQIVEIPETLLNYDADGTFIGREILPDADPTDFRRYRELALDNAIAFWTYRALNGI